MNMFSGSCNLPEGYPAPLPEVRVGNVVGAVGQVEAFQTVLLIF